MARADLNYFVWLIAYIDIPNIAKVEKELKKYPEYAEVEAHIPTIKILKKTKKGQQIFEEVPLLFNYGFFKVPRKHAIYMGFLEGLKNNISCIFGWVKDPLNVRPRVRPDQKSIFDNEIPVATATSTEVAELLKKSFNYSAHDSSDIGVLKPGEMITLRNYPFEGMEAEVVSINNKKKEIQVKIAIMDQWREMKVAFDNVFFTIYHNNNHDDSLTTSASLEVMMENRTLDKKLHKLYTDGEDK